MKQLNNYILEKLKVNSKTQISNEITEQIFYKYWGFTDEDKEILDIISTWVKNNGINDIIPIADSDAIADADFLDDSVIKEYNTDYKNVEECLTLLRNSERVYHKKERGEELDIYSSNELICIVGYYGTLYCVDSKIINK